MLITRDGLHNNFSYPRHKSSQACSAAKAINKGRRRIIKVSIDTSLLQMISTISTLQMLVIMLLVYYLCWGSWLASKVTVWWARDPDIVFNEAFYRSVVIGEG